MTIRTSILALLCAARLAAATYYVSLSGSDANNGSQAAPWRHIEYAMTRSLQPGDDIQIAGGIYRPDPVANLADPCYATNSCIDDALIRPTAAGTAAAPIVVHRLNGEEVVLTGRMVATVWTPDSGSVYYFDYTTPTTFPYDHPFQVMQDGKLLFGASSRANVNAPGKWYADQAAKRLYVWATDSASPDTHLMEYAIVRQGIEFTGAGVQNWRLSNLTLAGYRSYAVDVAQGAGTIDLNQMDISYAGNSRPGADLTNGFAVGIFATSGGNRIRSSNLHNTAAEAIHVSQTDAGPDTIEDNDIHDSGGAEWKSDSHNGTALIGMGMIVRGNQLTIRNNRISTNGYHGIDLESDLTGGEGVSHPSNNVVSGNSITGNAGNGIYLDGKNGLNASTGNTVRNNTLNVNNLRRGGNGDGEIRLRGNFDLTEISGNTITAATVSGLLIQAITFPNGGAQGADAIPENSNVFGNTIMYIGTDLHTYPASLTGTGSTFQQMDFDSLTLYGAGAAWNWTGTDYFTLPGFQAATGFEVHGKLCRRPAP